MKQFQKFFVLENITVCFTGWNKIWFAITKMANLAQYLFLSEHKVRAQHLSRLR